MVAMFAIACSPTGIEPANPQNLAQSARTEASEGIKIPASEDISKHPDYFEVRNNKGVLEFSTPEVFETYVKKMANLPETDLDKWESSLNFVSMRSILAKSKLEERKNFDTKVKNNLVNDARSAYFTQYQDLLNWEKGVTTLKMPLTQFANFLNQEGLVRVAGHLFQYTENSIKIIAGGDANKLTALKNAQKTDKANGIMVLPITNNKKPSNGRTEGKSYDIAYTSLPSSWPVSSSFFSVSMYLSQYSNPIYDYQNRYYVCDGGAGGRDNGCHWEYPIIGTEYRSSVNASMSAVAQYIIGGYNDLPIQNEIINFYGSRSGSIIGRSGLAADIPSGGVWIAGGANMTLFGTPYYAGSVSVYE
jgi:hypothetical protein